MTHIPNRHTLSIYFPLIDEMVVLALDEVLPRLRGEEFLTIASECLQDEGTVSSKQVIARILRQGAKSSDAVELVDKLNRFEMRYAELDTLLRNTRHYGPDGDEEPTICLDLEDLLDWLKENKPATLQTVLLYLVDGELKFTKTAGASGWEVRTQDVHILGEGNAGKRSEKRFSSLNLAQKDALQKLGVFAAVKAYWQTLEEDTEAESVAQAA